MTFLAVVFERENLLDGNGRTKSNEQMNGQADRPVDLQYHYQPHSDFNPYSGSPRRSATAHFFVPLRVED